MELREVDAASARKFIQRWHYARSASAGVLRYGWYSDDDELLGVSIYNNGFRATQNGVFGPEHASKVLHHHRLAITEEARSRGLKVSKFIKACNKRLGEEGYWAVVTYADLDFVPEGKDNPGHIYLITGAQYTGVETKGNLYFADSGGGLHSVSKTLGVTWSERRAEAARRGWTEHRSRGKLRFVYFLGTKDERRERRSMLRWKLADYPVGTR